MSRIYLVRHGQATFGAGDYDQLTDTGVAQCVQLASHWRAIGRRVDRVYAGTLRRQRAGGTEQHGVGAASRLGEQPRKRGGGAVTEPAVLLDARQFAVDPGVQGP